MLAVPPADAWNFGNLFLSPNQRQAFQYGPLSEFGQGSPLGGPGYWITPDQTVVLVHSWCGGPPVWEPSGRKVAFPVWKRHWLLGLKARVAVLDTATARLTIYAPRFRVVQLTHFDGQVVHGIDSPVYRPLLLDLARTPQKGRRELRKA